MPAVLLFVALLLPQQVAPQASHALRGRVILASNNPTTVQQAAPYGVRASNQPVEMVRAPALLVLGDPLWPGSIGRRAVLQTEAAPGPEPVRRAFSEPAAETRSAAMTYEEVTAARRARGAGQPPVMNFGKPDFSRPRAPGDQLALRGTGSTGSQAGPASLKEAPRSGLAPATDVVVERRPAEQLSVDPRWAEAAAAEHRPTETASEQDLPVAYQVEDKSGAFEIQQVSSTDTMPSRIVQTEDTTLYFSDGVPVYLRHTPSGQGGCYLEYDYGLDGHRSILGTTGYWLETPTVGGIALHWASENHIKLDLSHARVSGCELPAKLSLHRNGRIWETR